MSDDKPAQLCDIVPKLENNTDRELSVMYGALHLFEKYELTDKECRRVAAWLYAKFTTG